MTASPGPGDACVDAIHDPHSAILAAFRLPVAPDATEAITAALEAAYGPDLIVAERDGVPGWLVVTAAEHCSCCGHRYDGGHVRGEPCPCNDPAAWGAR